jgi:hypothetical protein
MTSAGGVTLNAEANLTFNGSTLTVTGTIVETSAKRYKTNIESLEDQLNKVLNLNPVRYEWINNGSQDIGLIAEEVYQIYPELVDIAPDGQIKGIKYTKMVSVLIKSIQELKQEIEQVKAQING